MGLRSKTALSITIVILVMFASLSAASKMMILDIFEDHETEHVKQNIDRAVDALNIEMDALDTTVNDWAAWNDTYDYMNDKNGEYIESNIVTGTFRDMSLNVILYADLDGAMIFGRTYDPETGGELDSSAELLNTITGETLIFTPREDADRVVGLIDTGDGPLIVASRPIRDSEETLPPNGILVMGRLFHIGTPEWISGIVHLDVNYSAMRDEMAADFDTAIADMQVTGQSTSVQILDRETIAGYAMVDDIEGVPLLVLKIDLHRDVYLHGVETFNYYQQVLIVVMGILGAITILVLETSILKRLSRLSAEVNSIGIDPTTSNRVSIAGRDEITLLASNINGMLQIKERFEDSQAELNRALNSKVTELEDYKRFTVNREFRMMELKRELEVLRGKSGEVDRAAD